MRWAVHRGVRVLVEIDGVEYPVLGSMKPVVDTYYEEKKARFGWDLSEYTTINEGERRDDEFVTDEDYEEFSKEWCDYWFPMDE